MASHFKIYLSYRSDKAYCCADSADDAMAIRDDGRANGIPIEIVRMLTGRCECCGVLVSTMHVKAADVASPSFSNW